MAVPISLAGSRWSVSSTTPSCHSQPSGFPVQRSSRRFPTVHRRNLRRKSPVDGIAPQFPIAGQQAVSRDKQFGQNREISRPAGNAASRHSQCRSHFARQRRHVAGDQRAKISAPISHHDHLLRSAQQLPRSFFNRLGRHIVARIQNDQVLDTSADAPVSQLVHFALIAGIEPTIFQYFARSPRACSNNFGKICGPRTRISSFSAQLHFDPGNRQATHTRLHWQRGIVHGADGGGFRQSVDLQDRNAEHHRKIAAFPPPAAPNHKSTRAGAVQTVLGSC